MRDLENHSGITMHRIAVGGGIMGAVFAIGSVFIFVVGLPVSRWFLLGSSLFGIGIAAVLYAWHKKHPVELTDLQDLSAPKQPSQR
jgi:hypothetical protein